MASEFKLELEKRNNIGYQISRDLRHKGYVPGIFYAADHDPVTFSIEKRHLYDALQSQSHVYSIDVGGNNRHAIFKEIQYHPVTEDIIHVDLFGVSLKDKINLSVPIILEGESSGVKTGGIMTQNITEVEIQCLATKVPDAIYVNVEELEVGDKLEVYLESLEDFHGSCRLSRSKARSKEIWSEIEKSFESGELVEGVITGKVKG